MGKTFQKEEAFSVSHHAKIDSIYILSPETKHNVSGQHDKCSF